MEVAFSQTIYAHTSYLSWDCHTFSRHHCGEMMLKEVVLGTNYKMQPNQSFPSPTHLLEQVHGISIWVFAHLHGKR